MAKVEKTAAELARAELAEARKIEDRFERIDAVQKAADNLRKIEAKDRK